MLEAEAAAAHRRNEHEQAALRETLAASYRAMHDAYREHEVVLAAVMADRADWERATRYQRQMAVAADAELRRRHPEQPWPPLRSAEPQLETDHANAVLTPGEEIAAALVS